VLWPGLHAALEKRPVVQSEVNGKGDSRGGKDCDKELKNVGLASILGSVIRRGRAWEGQHAGNQNADRASHNSHTNVSFDADRRRHKRTHGSTISRRVT
jgi:hypothetical protein